MHIQTLRKKLILSYIFVILVPFIIIAFFLDKSLEKNSLDNIKASLITQAQLIEGQVSLDDITDDSTLLLEAFVKELSGKIGCRITIIDNFGKVLADSEKAEADLADMENDKNRPEVKAAYAGGVGVDIRRSPTLKIEMLYVAVPIKDNENTVGVMRLALTLENVHKTLFAIRRIVFLGLAFALAFAFILGSILAARIT